MIVDSPVPALYPPNSVPERTLLFGMGGVGKSATALQIARRLDPSRSMFVIDTDYSAAYDRLLETEFRSVQDRVSARTIGPDDFMAVMEEIRAVKLLVKAGDWIVLDSITPTWQAVQSYFSEQVFGSDIDSYFLQVRKQVEESKKNKKTLGALDGWLDWPVINKLYFKLYSELLNTPANVLITAESTAISDDDDGQVKARFGTYGVRPAGQKKLGFVMHTNLLLTKSRIGEYRMTTIKDRGREEVENEPLGDFGLDYLVNKAGWLPVRPTATAA